MAWLVGDCHSLLRGKRAAARELALEAMDTLKEAMADPKAP
jgi:hypothetical protein